MKRWRMNITTNKWVRYLLQAINYTVFMALVWYFSAAPSIRILADDQAAITIAFAHAGDLREPCRKLSSEELAELAVNMRQLEDCPRERSPVLIQASLGGEFIYDVSLDPPGLFEDGGVDVYFSKRIPAGKHQFEIRMDDSVREQGFNHSFSSEFDVAPGRIILVSFDSERGFSAR
ncbi:MAG: hypothetical protein WBM41_18465 [Arenicellales bacterium]